MERQVLTNSLRRRCDSCGDTNSCTKYNNAYVCIACYRMDNRGIPRDNQGRIISSTQDQVLIVKPDANRKKHRRKK